jgi:uncharacterized protein YbaA (DUF1428 family)
MTYVEGFIVPVPGENKEAYRKHATDAAPLFQKVGVRRVVEAWDSDVPEGKLTDFRKAVDATPDEKVVFAWFEYPSRQERDAATEKMMSDPVMAEMGKDMPFDAKRMIIGGFEALVDEGESGGGFVDGWIVPVPTAKRDAYREHAARNAQYFREYGALRIVEAIADDVKHGQVTDFYRAIKAEPDETIVFAFIEWPDKATRDAGWGKIMNDERMMPDGEPPFNPQRMFWGGFDKMTDTAAQQSEQAQAPINA